MPNYNVFLHRVFSVQRLLGGILTILLTGSIVAGCTMSAGRGGLYFLIIAIPMVGIGFGLISKPYRLVCRTCNVKVDKKAQGAPFQSLLNGSLLAVAQSGDPGLLDHILRNAPLPDNPPAVTARSS